MADFIPLSADKSNKKRKHHHKEKNGDHRSGKSSERDRERPSPGIKHEARDPKLKDRICKYLEENRHKQYIDIQDMSKNLHTRYPEYNRKKFKAFQEICEAGFDYLQKTAAAAAAAASPPPAPTIEVSDSSAATAQHLSESTKTSSDEDSARSKTKKKKSDKSDENDVKRSKNVDETAVPVDTYSVVKMGAATSNVEASKTAIISETPKVVSIEDDANATKQPETVATTTVSSNVSQSECSIPLETRDTASKVVTPKIVPVETPNHQIGESLREPQLETPKRFTPLPTPKPFSSPNRKVPTKTVIDLTDGEDDVLSEMRQNGVSAKSSRKSSRAPSPVTASIKKSLIGRKKGPDFEVQQSNIKFNQLGGVDKVLIQICKLLIHLKHPEVYQHIGVTPARGILLHGPPGCGKTLLANAIAGELNLPILKLAATEIVSGISGESESRLRDLFDQAMAAAPCLLFIDEIDAITQRRDQSNKGMESRIVGQLLACMDDLNTKGNEKEGQVVVIGATNRPDVLDPALRRAGRFESEIAIGIPDENSRKQILEIMSRNLNVAPTFEMRQLARMTPGYVGADLASLLREAAINAVNRILYQLQPSHASTDTRLQLTDLLSWLSDNSPVPDGTLSAVQIDLSDFEKALKTVQPSSMREGFATVPNVTWSDVGALDDIREELEVSILAPVNYPELTEALGLEAPTGILLCGPPGCGKTLLAKAVANQAGINFISVKGPELLNMYVGESERAVRQVFQRAKNSAPCVIFFDELDSLAPRRSGSGDSSGASRVVNQLLTEMDGVEGRKGVYVMAATNRLDIIDPAVLRPGRLQKILHVDLPSREDRVSILKAITKRRPLLAADVDYVSLASDQRCDGYSGADLSALVTEAAMAAFKEHISRASRSSGLEPVPSSSEVRVFWRHFDSAFDKVKPSVTGKDKQHYETLKRKQQGGSGEKITKEQQPREKVVKLIPDQIQTADKAATSIPTNSVFSVENELENSQSDLAANETAMEEDESSTSSSCANVPKIPRYLDKMEVRIKDSSQKHAGCEGVVICIISPDVCLVQLKGTEEVQVPITDLEPFIPEPGDAAKILVSGESENVVQVIDYYSNPDYEEPDEENVTVEFENGDIKIIPLDQLCKIIQ